MKEGALANQKVGDGGKTEPRDTQLAVLLLGARQIEFLNHHSGPTMEAKMFPPPGAPASDTHGEKAEAGGGVGGATPTPASRQVRHQRVRTWEPHLRRDGRSHHEMFFQRNTLSNTTRRSK